MNLFSALLTLFVSFTSFAATEPMTSVGGKVNFLATGKPGFLKIRGESQTSYPRGQVELSPEGLKGEFSFNLEDLDTGISLRNQHMKEKYLDIKKFPDAKLVIKALAVKVGDLAASFTRDFTGDLTLHGVTKEIKGQLTWTAENKEARAQFQIKVSDYAIDIPSYLGVVVSETVDVDVLAKMKL